MLKRNRMMIFRAPDKGAAGGTPSEPLESTVTPPAFNPEMLAALPGSELLGTLGEEVSTEPEDDESDDEDEIEGDDDEADDESDGSDGADESDEDEDAEEADDDQGDEDEEDEDEENQDDPEIKTWPKSAQKRVDKLTALKGEAERERDAVKAEKASIEAELAELKAKGPAPVVAPTPANPLAHVTQARDLEAHAAFSEQLQGWALENLTTGGTMPAELDAVMTGRTVEQAKAEPTDFDPKAVGRILHLAQQRLTKDIPQRAQYLTADAAANQYVQTHYPAMLKPESEEGKLYAQYVHQFPEIQRFPNWRVAMVDVVRGAMLRMKEEDERKAAKESPGKTGSGSKPAGGAKTAKPKLAPVVPGVQRAGGATARVAKPGRGLKLSASMTSDELAAAMLNQQRAA